MKKIAMTGHTKGLGKILFDNFEIDGFSRSNGYNTNNVDHVISTIKKYDIFINNVQHNQVDIAQKLWALWKDNPKKKIINIGSRAKDFIKTDYGFKKHMLSEFSKHANFNGDCRVSCVNFGYLNKLTDKQIIEAVSYVLNTDYIVEEITVFGYEDKHNNH